MNMRPREFYLARQNFEQCRAKEAELARKLAQRPPRYHAMAALYQPFSILPPVFTDGMQDVLRRHMEASVPERSRPRQWPGKKGLAASPAQVEKARKISAIITDLHHSGMWTSDIAGKMGLGRARVSEILRHSGIRTSEALHDSVRQRRRADAVAVIGAGMTDAPLVCIRERMKWGADRARAARNLARESR